MGSLDLSVATVGAPSVSPPHLCHLCATPGHRLGWRYPLGSHLHRRGSRGHSGIRAMALVLIRKVPYGNHQTGHASRAAYVSRRGCHRARREPILRLPIDRRRRLRLPVFRTIAGCALADESLNALLPASFQSTAVAVNRARGPKPGARPLGPFAEVLSDDDREAAGAVSALPIEQKTGRRARLRGGLRPAARCVVTGHMYGRPPEPGLLSALR